MVSSARIFGLLGSRVSSNELFSRRSVLTGLALVLDGRK